MGDNLFTDAELNALKKSYMADMDYAGLLERTRRLKESKLSGDPQKYMTLEEIMGLPPVPGFSISPNVQNKEVPKSQSEGASKFYKLPEVKKKSILPNDYETFSSSNWHALAHSTGKAEVRATEVTTDFISDHGVACVELIPSRTMAAVDDRLNPFVAVKDCENKIVEVGAVELEVRGLAARNSDMQIGSVLLDTRHAKNKNAVLAGSLVQAANTDQHVLMYPATRLALHPDINRKIQVVSHSDNSDFEEAEVAAKINVRALSEVFDSRRTSHPTKKTIIATASDDIMATKYKDTNCLVVSGRHNVVKEFHGMNIPMPRSVSMRMTDVGDFCFDDKGRKSVSFFPKTGVTALSLVTREIEKIGNLNDAGPSRSQPKVCCSKHSKEGCDKCVQGAGSQITLSDLGFSEFFEAKLPQGIVLKEWLPAARLQVSVPLSTNPGTEVFSLPIGEKLNQAFPGTNYLTVMSWYSISVQAKIGASGTISSKGTLRVLYDARSTLSVYPSRERALMLPGVNFQPGRTEDVLFEFEAVTVGGQLNHAVSAGFLKVVLLDHVGGFTNDFYFDIDLSVKLHEIFNAVERPFGFRPYSSEQFSLAERTRAWLPLGTLVHSMEIKDNLTKGSNFVFPLNPNLPASDGAQYYPSLSSSVLERATMWRGTLVVSLYFSLPVAAGGRFSVAIAPNTGDGWTLSQHSLFGEKTFDLRSTRKVTVPIPYTAWFGFNRCGEGNLLGGDLLSPNNNPRLILSTLSGIYFPGTDKTGSIFCIFEGIHNFSCAGCSDTVNRVQGTMIRSIPAMSEAESAVISAGESSGEMEKRIRAEEIFRRKLKEEFSEQDNALSIKRKEEEERKALQVAREAEVAQLKIYNSLLPKGLATLYIRVTKSPAYSLLILPVCPDLVLPTVGPEGSEFTGSNNPVLSHRAQEFAFWRGHLEFCFEVRRKTTFTSKVSPVIEVTLKPPSAHKEPDFVVGKEAALEGKVANWIMDFSLDSYRTLLIEEPNWSSWKVTQNPVADYSVLGITGWLEIRMPSGSFAEAGIELLMISVKEQLEFMSPAPPNPITKTVQDAVRVWENHHPVV
uniref:Polyprotein n=1 Tax=Beach cabbage stralarivirus TaxID=3115811 RepID=A0AAT9JHB3_9SECO